MEICPGNNIDIVSSKISKGTGILYKSRDVINQAMSKTTIFFVYL